MKAVRIHAYGSAEVLNYEDVPVPTVAPDELLVRVVAASVNPVDWKIRRGYLRKFIPYELPLTLGWDVSGVVVAVGSLVSQFAVGDAVYSRPDIKRNGTYAEFVAIRAAEVAHKPHTLSHVEAATLPLAGITAWESLFTMAQLQSNQRVLIHAAAGGVGSLAVQLAKSRGAHVTATASAKNRQLVESLGADVVIDYQAQPFEQVAREQDVVFDTIGGATQKASWAVLRKGGILVSITDPPAEEVAKSFGVRSAYVFIQPDATILEQLAHDADAGKLRPIIGGEYALRDVVKAHAQSETGRTVGKIVLYVGEP